jgi:imidazoleglycerol-phosphate dehydratase
MRRGEVARSTKETEITARVDLDGTGACEIGTGIGFFDHMLEQLGRHALIDITLTARGDLDVDAHHTVEDCGIALGQAMAEALGDRAGIQRYGDVLLPMDEALTQVAVDLSNRAFLVWKVPFARESLGALPTELVPEFFRAFTANAGATLHVVKLHGENDHHVCETCFKGVARALRAAVAEDPRGGGAVPSTKGAL